MESLLKLGIDWKAILIYIVNFGVIVFILSKFVFKPLRTFLEERRAKTIKALEDVEKLKAEFGEKVAERKATEQKLIEEASELRSQIEGEKKDILKEAYAEKDAILSKARTEAEKLRDEIITSFETEIIERISEVVESGFKNNLSPENIKLIVEDTWKEIISKKQK